jgi:hypothetical protein
VVVIGTDTIAIITVSWTNSRAFTIFVTLVSARNTVVQFLAVSYATCTGDTYTAGISDAHAVAIIAITNVCAFSILKTCGGVIK